MLDAVSDVVRRLISHIQVASLTKIHFTHVSLDTLMSINFQNSLRVKHSVGRKVCTKPNKMGLTSEIHMVEGENHVLQVVLCHLLLYCGVHAPPVNKQ